MWEMIIGVTTTIINVLPFSLALGFVGTWLYDYFKTKQNDKE